jgi:nucleoside 2-deoxyribosyltransferase
VEIPIVYLAGPLFTGAEHAYNEALAQKITALGFEVYLPQDVTSSYIGKVNWQSNLYHALIRGIYNAHLVVAVLDGPDVDSGTAWEAGWACANGKTVFGLRTDFRSFGEEGKVNLMVDQSCEEIATSEARLVNCLKRWKGDWDAGR